jgi:hypothetical protein
LAEGRVIFAVVIMVVGLVVRIVVGAIVVIKVVGRPVVVVINVVGRPVVVVNVTGRPTVVGERVSFANISYPAISLRCFRLFHPGIFSRTSTMKAVARTPNANA